MDFVFEVLFVRAFACFLFSLRASHAAKERRMADRTTNESSSWALFGH